MAEEYEGEEKRVQERRATCNCANTDEIKELFDERDRTQTFRAQAKIVGIVAFAFWSAVFTASFAYTYSHIQSSSRMSEAIFASLKSEDNKLHRMANTLQQEVFAIKSDVAVVNDRYIRLLVDIGKVERKIEVVINLLVDDAEE